MLVPGVLALKRPLFFPSKSIMSEALDNGLAKGARAKNALLLQIPERSAHLPPNKKVNSFVKFFISTPGSFFWFGEMP